MSVIDKYVPQSLGDVIIPNTKIAQTLGHVANGNLERHLILHGPSGTGKSTIARLILAQLEATKVVQVETDYNHVLGQKNVWAHLETARHILSWQATNGKYIMHFDEFDKCKHTYEKFWNALDRFKKSDVMLIATTNNLHKLPTPLQSRCTVLHIDSLTVQDVLQFAINVLDDEGIYLNVPYIIGRLNIVAHTGDFRKYCDQLDEILVNHTSGFIPQHHYVQTPPITTQANCVSTSTVT